ncbi:MAG: hypothetical protein ACRDOM_05115 [Nocardioides sp.]
MSSLPLLAGAVSTVVFAVSTLPMLRKAASTRDLASYSLGNIGMANIGNLVHSVYVLSLPPGPIWVLHAFYTSTSALMLLWYLRYAAGVGRNADSRTRETGSAADAELPARSLASGA